MPSRSTPTIEQGQSASRDRLLDAARHLFAAQGYRATTTREIVAAANGSMGNLYFHFSDKEGMLQAVLEAATREAAHKVDAALGHVSPGPAQLVIAVVVGVESLLAETDLARIVFVEAPQSGLRATVMAPFSERVRRFFEARPDLLDGLPSEVAAAAWVGALWQAVERQLDATQPLAGRDLGRALARWNLRALGLSPAIVDNALREADIVLNNGSTGNRIEHTDRGNIQS
jgi:AcrR family transcriptional regulator